MKKILLLLPCIILLCSCSLIKDDLDGATIYTTIYPISYLTDYLYKDYATIDSIYPENITINDYKLTDKQVQNYAKGDLFIYNGLSSEKSIAKSLLNENKHILIIDVSYGLAINKSVQELWLSPNNYLMLAKNIKDNLTNYLKNKYIIENVNKKYDQLAEILSLMDADLRSVSKQAESKNSNTVVVSSDAFKYLENYGFNVISLSDSYNSSESGLTVIKNNFKNGKYKILINEYDKNEIIDDLVSNYNAKKIGLKTMETISDDEDYITIMNAFIDSLRNNI